MVLGLAIASALALGIADYLAGATLRRDGRTSSALAYTAIGSALGAVVVLAALPLAPPEEFTRSDLVWSVAAGISVGLALPLLMIGMARGPVSVVAPVLGLVSLAVPATVGPLLGDRLSGLEVVGLLIAFPAAGLVSLSGHPGPGSGSIARGVAIAAGAGAFFGTSAVCFGQTSTASGIAPGVVAQMTTTVLLVTLALGLQRAVRPQKEAVWLAAGVGVLTAVAVFLSVLAYQRGPVAIVAAVIGLAPGPTVLLAWVLTKERIKVPQYFGFGLGVAAVVLFAAG